MNHKITTESGDPIITSASNNRLRIPLYKIQENYYKFEVAAHKLLIKQFIISGKTYLNRFYQYLGIRAWIDIN